MNETKLYPIDIANRIVLPRKIWFNTKDAADLLNMLPDTLRRKRSEFVTKRDQSKGKKGKQILWDLNSLIAFKLRSIELLD